MYLNIGQKKRTNREGDMRQYVELVLELFFELHACLVPVKRYLVYFLPSSVVAYCTLELYTPCNSDSMSRVVNNRLYYRILRLYIQYRAY